MKYQVFMFHLKANIVFVQTYIILCIEPGGGGAQWQSGNTLASPLRGQGSATGMASSGKTGSCLPLVGSLQYITQMI